MRARVILAGMVALAAIMPAVATAEGSPPPSASRVYKLCLLEDPDCGPLILASYDRMARTHGRCPAGQMLPVEIVIDVWLNLGRLMAGGLSRATGRPLTVDEVTGDAISTVSPSYCRPGE